MQARELEKGICEEWAVHHLSTLTTKLMLWLHSPAMSKAGLTSQAQSSFDSDYNNIT